MSGDSVTRRRFVVDSLLAVSATWTAANGATPLDAAPSEPGDNLHLAPFEFDVTPPVGHSCCGGWIKPVIAIDDPLLARGFVVLGGGKPIVICAVDWTGLLNEAHVQWRSALASAARTTPDRVAVQCVHQHNAPFACLDAQRIVAAQGDLPDIVDETFFGECLERAGSAVEKSLANPRRVTHIATGRAAVAKVASNRRVARDADGRVVAMRGSSSRNPDLVALPEGLIDPWVKTVAFYNQREKIAACHYYATHPMSYYGDGRVTSDFAGLARRQRQRDEPNCLHICFTGCAGNIAAGKYNDGSLIRRPILTHRLYEGIARSEQALKPEPVTHIRWRTAELLPTLNPKFSAEALEAIISDRTQRVVNRNRPAYELSWLRRVEKRVPVPLSALEVNGVTLLHLPAEPFIQYQLRAQEIGGAKFVATAGYGDGGPWYIPTREEYPNGGYEVSVAFSDPSVDDALTAGIRRLLV